MRVSPKRSAWARRSDEVSIRMVAPPGRPIRIEGRDRLSRGSVDRHTAQAQPIIGTPMDVPVPRKVTFTGLVALAEGGLTGRVSGASRNRQGMMMRDFSGAPPPSLVASMYFRRSS